MSKPTIPRMKTTADTRTHGRRVSAILRIVREESWDVDETLRAISAVVFYSGRPRRERVIAWLEELLKDLKDTKRKLLDPDDGDFVWPDECRDKACSGGHPVWWHCTECVECPKKPTGLCRKHVQ